jgi:hypothetical protein
VIAFDERKFTFIVNILSIILGIAISLLGYFFYKELITFICIFVGVLLILINIYPLVAYSKLMKDSKIYIVDFIITIGFILLGGMFIINHGLAMSIVFGAYCIVFPIIRIIISKQKKRQFKREIPLFIIGALMFFNVSDEVFRFALVGVGILLALLGFINIILSKVVYKKIHDDPNLIDVNYEDIQE